MQYFMIINGSQAGPFRADELLGRGLTPETYVWHEGMTDWAKARTLPELSVLFAGRPNERPYGNDPYRQPENRGNFGNQERPRYNDPYQGQPGNTGYYNGNSYDRNPYPAPIPHTNWLPWAIAATVLNCFASCIGLIFSIIGIVQANKANNMYAQGFAAEGDAANSSAKTMTIIAFVLGVIGIIGAILMLFTGLFGAFSYGPFK